MIKLWGVGGSGGTCPPDVGENEKLHFEKIHVRTSRCDLPRWFRGRPGHSNRFFGMPTDFNRSGAHSSIRDPLSKKFPVAPFWGQKWVIFGHFSRSKLEKIFSQNHSKCENQYVWTPYLDDLGALKAFWEILIFGKDQSKLSFGTWAWQ